MEFHEFFTLLISFVALFFSIRTYKRDNRLTNENQLYALKMDVYSRAIGEVAKLVIMVEDNLIYAKSAMGKNDVKRLDDLDDHADRLDDACEEFEVFVISNSLALPEEILNLLFEFTGKVQNIKTLDSTDINSVHVVEKISKMDYYLKELVKSADEMSKAFRRDLKIEELNSSLYNRLNKSK